MTLLDLAIFLAVYLGLTVAGYLWQMRRHDRKMKAIWDEHTRLTNEIWDKYRQQRGES